MFNVAVTVNSHNHCNDILRDVISEHELQREEEKAISLKDNQDGRRLEGHCSFNVICFF